MSFHTKNKWVIGLTGPMLSGKSTALAYFAACGAGTVSCDEIVRELYTCPAVLKKIHAALGATEKTEIAARVFKNAAKRSALEQILHPLILKRVQAQIKNCKQPIIVVEVPLLFEAGWERKTDLNIALWADEKSLSLRLKERNISLTQYQRRSRQQLSAAQKAQRADVVFFHTSKAQLKRQVTHFYNALSLLHK